MSIFRLVYVGCDGCGMPASEPVDTAKEARELAPGNWVKVARTRETKGGDYCPSCAQQHAPRSFEQDQLPLG